MRTCSSLLAAVLTLFGCAAVRETPPSSEVAELALVGATIYADPVGEPIRDGVILVCAGRITAVGERGALPVPPGATVLDCAGATVTAGFWNSHAHFFEEEWENAASIPAPVLARQLQDMLTRYGFTSVFDLGSTWENTRRIRARVEAGEVQGPRVLTTGEPLMAPGALPAESLLRSLGYMPLGAMEVTDDRAAAEATRELLERGVDGIKVHLQPPRAPGPRVPESAIHVAVELAHRAGKPVFVHPDDGADVLVAVRSGVDVIAHTTPGSGPWDEALLVAMQEAGVALTPTLALWNSPMAVEQLRAWAARGGAVLFGNDLGAVAYDPRAEYARMAEAGMSLRQILASLTTAPAERFGESERLGRVAPGLLADLVVLERDPAEDVLALAEVRLTLRDGQVVFSTVE